MTIAVVNPLPAALAHYADELDAVLRAAGLHPCTQPSPSIEQELGDSVVVRTARTLRWRHGFRTEADDAILLWPAFGLLDPVSLRRTGAKTWLVIHDPTPLRRQLGMGRIAGWIGRRALGDSLQIIVHSRSAEEVLAERKWPAHRVRHPILPPGAQRAHGGNALSVIGQWKPARSIEPLHRLAEDRVWNGRRRICGRGWTDMDGWNVENRFLSEAEIDERISSSAAVVLPYAHYYQSGIAVRCLEQGVPVVGRRHPFLTDLYGVGWPGTVVGDDWSGAVRRAINQPANEIRQLHATYWDRCVDEWTGLLERVDRD